MNEKILEECTCESCRRWREGTRRSLVYTAILFATVLSACMLMALIASYLKFS